MSLDEFLEYTSKRKREIEAHLRNKEKFVGECFKNIFSIFEAFYRDCKISENKDFEKKLQVVCEDIFDLFPAFTDHYKKTEKLTFGITPENDWIKEIDTTDSLSELKNKVSWENFEKAEEYVNKLQELRKQQLMRDKVYTEIHLCFKRLVYQFFPEITELPSKGFLELDYLLFNFSKEAVNVCISLLKKLQNSVK